MTTGDPEESLRQARRRLKEIGWSDLTAWRRAAQDVLSAERALAASRGEPFAQVIDLGFHWDTGAPMPHLLSNGSRAFVLCYVGTPDPAFDGTSVEIVSPDDARSDRFGMIELWGCASVRLGAPNDEALRGHPLHGKGLEPYAGHEIHNSAWLEEHIRINSGHPYHSDEAWRRLHHYVLLFHDEMLEALADGIEGRVVHTTLRSLLDRITSDLVERPHRRS